MRWQSKVPKRDTEPEMTCRRILEEMKLNFTGERIKLPTRNCYVEADFIVEGCLIIEVQGTKWHMKSARRRKDAAKKEGFLAMGMATLELWDWELAYADQKKRGPVWRIYVKEMITLMLDYSRKMLKCWAGYVSTLPLDPVIRNPEGRMVKIGERNE